jgi:hypothetical protein
MNPEETEAAGDPCLTFRANRYQRLGPGRCEEDGMGWEVVFCIFVCKCKCVCVCVSASAGVSECVLKCVC